MTGTIRLIASLAMWALFIAGLGLAAGPAQSQNSDGAEVPELTPTCNTPTGGDYDDDDDGLIEVSCRAQLKAIHTDLDGDGSPQSDIAGAEDLYATAYPDAASGMGCPQTGCIGYELTADLDFDTNDVAGADEEDWYTNLEGSRQSAWFGFGYYSGGSFSAVFEGNGHVIKNLYIESRAYTGLFAQTTSEADIRNVGVEDLVLEDAAYHIGGLVGHNEGRIINSYTTGVVSGTNGVGGLVGGSEETSMIIGSYSAAAVTGSSDDVGGLVGGNEGTIVASYATGSVTGTGESHAGYIAGSDSGNGHAIGGLVGLNYPEQKIIASYATGTVTAASGQKVGGLVGYNQGSIIASYSTGAASGKEEVHGLAYSDTAWIQGSIAAPSATFSYWDSTTSGVTAGSPDQGLGKTTAQLQATTRYTGAFAYWNMDLDNDGSPDDPWDFGTTCQYPVLKYGRLDPDSQRATCQAVTPPANTGFDYDSDDDGLIEVSDLYQLSAIRWDLDGDGVIDDPTYPYSAAFLDPVDTGLGCPSTGCIGYELVNNLDMDTNNDGTVDEGDTFAVWTPIGTGDGFGLGAVESFGAILEGNGHTISNLRVRREVYRGVGMFISSGEGSVIRNLGLVDVDVSSRSRVVGGLAGGGFGEISNSYVTGVVSGRGYVGGLVGYVGETGVISDSYSAAAVTNQTDFSGGGLAGVNQGVISGSYATGDVTGEGYGLGGLVGHNRQGRISASYATGDVSSTAGLAAGGLAGQDTGTITASYATGAVSGNLSVGAGGLIGVSSGRVSYSYSTGSVSNDSDVLGGLIGILSSEGEVNDSYWDTTTSGLATGYGGTGKPTRELQVPTEYTGIYANWNADLDDDGSPDDPWDFGATCQYPVLKYGDLDPDSPARDVHAYVVRRTMTPATG